MSQALPPPSPEAQGAIPVCPVHPDRQTQISCTRCGRPVCYECMVAAPVGFQCKECVSQAAKTAPVYTQASAFSAGGKSVPYVTYALVAICAAAFLFALVGGGVEASAAKFGMRPIFIALDGQWYRFITSAFLHWSILHIGFNMLVLIMLGPTLERVLGHLRFTTLYLLAAIGGSVASYCFSPEATASVGASGAIFGLMGALIVAGRQLRYDVTQVVVLLGINLVIGFIPGSAVDWRAHLGGLVTGAAVAAVFAYAPKRHTALIQLVGCVAIVAVLGAAVAWRTAALQEEFQVPDQTPVVTASGTSGTLGSDLY